MQSASRVILRWGPCDGDMIDIDIADATELRLPVVCGVCLDELPVNLGKDIYTEAIYMPDSNGVWWYAGRMRYRDGGGEAYWSSQ